MSKSRTKEESKNKKVSSGIHGGAKEKKKEKYFFGRKRFFL
jgi:hypothetical protein